MHFALQIFCPLTSMENPAHPEGSGSHTKCSIMENMAHRCSVRIGKSPHMSIMGQFYRHFVMESVPNPLRGFVGFVRQLAGSKRRESANRRKNNTP